MNNSDSILHPVVARLAALILLASGAGCARVGPPLPPLQRIPAPLEGLQARQSGRLLEITIPLPRQNADGSPLESYQRLELAGRLLPGNSPSSAGTPDILLLTVTGEDLPLPGQMEYWRTSVEWPEKLGGSGGMLLLGVRLANDRMHWSPWPAPLRLPVLAVAELSGPLRGTLSQNHILLEWPAPRENFDGSQPARLDGFLVLRQELPAGTEHEAARLQAGETRFSDSDFRFDTKYRYRLAAFAKSGEAVCQGNSLSAEIETRDTFPPAAPGDLSLFLEEGRIKLIWTPVSDPDIAGYLIYRRGESGQFQKITATPLTAPMFLDPAADPSVAWYYQINAIDTHGNTGPPSAASRWNPVPKK